MVWIPFAEQPRVPYSGCYWLAALDAQGQVLADKVIHLGTEYAPRSIPSLARFTHFQPWPVGESEGA